MMRFGKVFEHFKSLFVLTHTHKHARASTHTHTHTHTHTLKLTHIDLWGTVLFHLLYFVPHIPQFVPHKA